MRWTLGASDIVFTKRWYYRSLSLGRVVPVLRRDRIYQNEMDFALDVVHMSEGTQKHTWFDKRLHK